MKTYREIRFHIIRVLIALSIFSLYGCSASDKIPDEHCYLCEGLRHHAPCLVNLSTGEILELAVYDSDPIQQGELSQTQTTGFYAFTMIDGVVAIRNAGIACSASLSSSSNDFEEYFFCDTCTTKILAVSDYGYVLADLYNLTNIQLFSLTANSNFTLRNYDISVFADTDKNEVEIEVRGTLDS